MTSRNPPTTHHSLLVRLRDANDQAAWDEFFAIYQPLIVRLARARGFQEADAQELAQDVLLKISYSVDSYCSETQGVKHTYHLGADAKSSQDGSRKNSRSFRAWLAAVTRNHALNRLRKSQPQPVGGTSFHRRLESLVDPGNPLPNEQGSADEREFEYERRRQAFLWAAENLRPRFSEANWQAFWMTCVEGRSVESVAQLLGMSAGKIYVARCRVIARLRETVQRITEEF